MAIGDQHYQPPRSPKQRLVMGGILLAPVLALAGVVSAGTLAFQFRAHAAGQTTSTQGPKAFATPPEATTPTPKPTATPTATPSATATPAPTATPTATPTPSSTPTATVTATPDATKTGLLYAVPPEIETILRQITENDPISYEVMVNLLGSESGFKNVVSETGATGIGQFTQAPFIERAYKIRDLVPDSYDAITGNIIEDDVAKIKEEKLAKRENREAKYVLPKYEYRIGGKNSKERTKNRQALLDLRNDFFFSAVAAREHIRETLQDARERFEKAINEKIAHITTNKKKYPVIPAERVAILRAHLERPWTIIDAKAAYTNGARGGSQLLVAAADIATERHGIKDYTVKEVAHHNRKTLTKGGKNMNPSQFLAYMNERVGNITLPKNLERPAKASATIVVASLEPNPQ